MLPIRSSDGTIVAFIGRASSHAHSGTPKYLNSPSTSVYNKSAELFGLWEARDTLASGARPVIVEGPFDAIAVTIAGSGRHVGIAPCGTALTDRHVTALAQAADLPAAGVSVAFDPDQAGRRAAVHAYHLLVPLTAKLAAVSLPAGQDPAQVLASSGPGDLAAILTENTRPLPDLVINAAIAPWSRWLRHPEGQIHALRAAAPLIAAMPGGHVARQVARLASILRLDHATVTQAVTDALTELINGAPSRHPPDTPYSARQAIEHAPEAAVLTARSKRGVKRRPRLTSRTPQLATPRRLAHVQALLRPGRCSVPTLPATGHSMSPASLILAGCAPQPDKASARAQAVADAARTPRSWPRSTRSRSARRSG